MHHLCQDPGDQAQPNNPTPPDLHQEAHVSEALADHGHQADRQPEDSGEAAQGEGQRQEVQELQEVQEVQEVQVRQRRPENEVSEVDIPNVGRITVRADADGYNEEVSSGSPFLLLRSGSSLLVPSTDDADSSHAGRHPGHRQGQADLRQRGP